MLTLMLMLMLQGTVEQHVQDHEARLQAVELDVRILQERANLKAEYEAQAHKLSLTELTTMIAAGFGALGAGKLGWGWVRG
jgi:hypothetical protein